MVVSSGGTVGTEAPGVPLACSSMAGGLVEAALEVVQLPATYSPLDRTYETEVQPGEQTNQTPAGPVPTPTYLPLTPLLLGPCSACTTAA